MTTATEITTALTDVLGAVDEAKDMVEDLHDELETTLTHARRGQRALEILEIVWRLHDSQVTDGRVVCPTCQVSWPCETAQAIRYTECFPF